MVITVTLNPSIDKTVVIPGFALGEEFRAEKVHCCAGGKGINVTRTLNGLGINGIATGLVGGSVGDLILEDLHREGIRHDFTRILGNNRINVSVYEPRTGRMTRILERGPRTSPPDAARFLVKFRRLLKRASWVVLSGRLARGLPNGFYGRLIEEASHRRVHSALDADGVSLKLAAKRRPSLIKINLQEAQEFSGRSLKTDAAIVALLKDFYKNGTTLSAVTMGKKGAVAYDGRRVLRVIPPGSRKESTVGCGDAFMAGWIASLEAKRPFDHALRVACACAAANVLTASSGYIRPAVVRRVAGRVRIKPVPA